MPIFLKTSDGKKVPATFKNGKIAPTDSTSSIKPKTLPDKPPSDPLQNEKNKGKIVVSAPFIDKISVVMEPPNEKEAHNSYLSIMESQGEKAEFIDAGSKAKWGEYRWAKRIKLPSLIDPKKFPLLQISYDKKGGKILRYRIEFVPVDLGTKGMEELHLRLTGYLQWGWGSFVKHGRITRLDVAVNVPKKAIDTFYFLPAQGATFYQWRVDGVLNGYHHGKKTGNQTVIYDRGEKRTVQGKSSRGKEGARIERRLRNQELPLKKLADLGNPFEAMKIVSMPEAPPTEQKKTLYVWNLFRRAADVQGLPAALALLPEEKRTLYRKHLKDYTEPWWEPPAIWQKWKPMLDELKIASSKAWE